MEVETSELSFFTFEIDLTKSCFLFITGQLRGFIKDSAESVVDAVIGTVNHNDHRKLQLPWNKDCKDKALIHPVYSDGWQNGYCALVTTCNSPSYATVKDCCDLAFAGQCSAFCYAKARLVKPGVPCDEVEVQ